MTTPSSPPSDLHPAQSDSPTMVKCPTCGGASVFAPSNKFRPFCSNRCYQIDLGAWANEEFRVPSEAPPDDATFGDPRTEN